MKKEDIKRELLSDYKGLMHITKEIGGLEGCGNIETIPDLISISDFYINFIDDIADIISNDIIAQKIYNRYIDN